MKGKRKENSHVKMVSLWNRLPSKAVLTPFLMVFKTRLDKALRNLL